MKNFWIIEKFTFNDAKRKKIFFICNIAMMLIVMLLTTMVGEIDDITKGYIQNEVTERFTGYDNTEDTYENVNINTAISSAEKDIMKSINEIINPGFIMAFILFFSITFYGYMVSSSIANEKTSRVLETLITSAKPEEIVLGKTVAMGILGIFQMFLLALTALITFIVNNIDFSKLDFNFSSIQLETTRVLGEFGFSFDFGSNMGVDFTRLDGILTLIIIFTFFVFGYMLYAFVSAITGACVTKAEDIQNANGPISMLAMLAFYISVISARSDGNSVFAKYFPFSSPFAVPVNLAAGKMTINESLISLFVLFISVIWLAKVSIKIYRHVIYNLGRKTTFKDVIKIMFLGK